MGITSVNVNNSTASTAVAAVKSVDTQPDRTVEHESTISAVKAADNKPNTGTTTDENQPSENKFKNITDELNNFMQSINTDIKFVLHTRTNELMIQVEDSKTHKVLKEFPSHELLDMVARIRDYIGAFLDKKV